MMSLYDLIKKCNIILFSTLLYYHSFSAQLKMAIDRFHGVELIINKLNIKTFLFITAASSQSNIAHGAIISYRTTINYLNWANSGELIALNCATKADIIKTDYPAQAYSLGISL